MVVTVTTTLKSDSDWTLPSLHKTAPMSAAVLLRPQSNCFLLADSVTAALKFCLDRYTDSTGSISRSDSTGSVKPAEINHSHLRHETSVLDFLAKFFEPKSLAENRHTGKLEITRLTLCKLHNSEIKMQLDYA